MHISAVSWLNSGANFSHFVNMIVYFQVWDVLRAPLIATPRYNDIKSTVPQMSLQRGPTVHEHVHLHVHVYVRTPYYAHVHCTSCMFCRFFSFLMHYLDCVQITCLLFHFSGRDSSSSRSIPSERNSAPPCVAPQLKVTRKSLAWVTVQFTCNFFAVIHWNLSVVAAK